MEFGAVSGIPSKISGDSNSTGNNQPSSVVSIPTNHSIWLMDYKAYGENSYVFQDKDIWDELMNSRVAINDKDVISVVRKYFTDTGKDPLKMLCNIYGINIDIQDGQTFADIIQDEDNAKKIINHELGFELVASYSLYIDQFLIMTNGVSIMMNSPHFQKMLSSAQVITNSNVSATTSGASYYYLDEMYVDGQQAYSDSGGTYPDTWAVGCNSAQSGGSYVCCDDTTVTVAAYHSNGSNSSKITKTVYPKIIVKSASIQRASFDAWNSSSGGSTGHTNCSMKYRKLFV